MINWTKKPVTGTRPNWNGCVKGNAIELRRTFHHQLHYAQLLIILEGKQVTLSMTGKAVMTTKELLEISEVVTEAENQRDFGPLLGD